MKPFSKQDEQKLLEAGKHFYSTAFPNPDRIGCPPQEILKAMALRKYDRNKAKQWDDQMSHCFPCFNEYMAFREEARRSARLRMVAVAAAAAVVLAVIAGWLAQGKFGSRGESWRQASLDLRGHEAFRGAGAPKTAPLVLARGRLELTLDLPTGSEPGDYDVQLTQGTSQRVAMASGRAELVDSVAVLKVRIDLGEANVGQASLLLRRSGQSWAPYALLLK